MKHAYLIEARGHPGHDVIRNFYQSQGLEDGKIYNKQGRCVGDDQMVTNIVQNHEGQEIEQKGWQGGDGENTLNLKQIIQGTYATMVSRFLILRAEGHKFTPGVATMWARGEFGQNFDSGNVNAFNESLNLLVKYHSKDYDKFLRNIANGDTKTPKADEIIDRFSQARSENIQAAKDKINSKEYTNTKYFIKPITKYDDLLQYKPFCYPKNVWCLMNGEGAWNSYTSKGLNQFYLVLDKRLCDEKGDPIIEEDENGRKRIKNINLIPTKEGEGHPNDEYGLSMMGIIVDMHGELAYCTTRWNHAGRGTDHTMDAEEISDTLGVNFYQTFKPNHKFQEKIEKALFMYRESGSLKGFDTVEKNKNGLMKVELGGKYNFLTTEGELISEKWFDIAFDFNEGLVLIYIKNKGCNFINTNGQPIFNMWFTNAKYFNEGLAPVFINNKGWTFINIKGEKLNDNWYDDAGNFYNGIASVYDEKLGFNFINKQGNLICKDFFKDFYKYKDNIYKITTNDNNKLLLNTNGDIMTYDYYVQTTLNNFYKSGDIKLFDRIEDSNLENYNIVTILNKVNLLNIKTNEFLSNIWFNNVEPFTNGYAKVYKTNMGYNIINTRGELISNEYFQEVHIIDERVKIVKTDNDGLCYLKTNGDLLNVKNMSFIRNVSPQQNDEDIANESLIRKYANEFNEVLDLNNRIKKLYK